MSPNADFREQFSAIAGRRLAGLFECSLRSGGLRGVERLDAVRKNAVEQIQFIEEPLVLFFP